MDDIAAQAEKDAKYCRDYQQWYDSLSQKERAKVDAMGLSSPTIDYSGNMRSADISEMQIPEFVDQPSVEVQTTSSSDPIQFAGDILRKLIGEMASMPNVSLTLDCLMIILKIGETIPTETELARKHRVTRAAVSKRCITLMDTFRISPPSMLKSERARRTYSRTQKKTHAKRIQRTHSFRPRACGSR